MKKRDIGKIILPLGAKLIFDKKAFEDFYHYQSPPLAFPRRYPCIVRRIYHDGGLGGGSVEHQIVYFPSKVNHYDFLIGFKAGVEAMSNA